MEALVTACWAIAVAVGLLFMVGCWLVYVLLRGVNEIIRGLSALDQHLTEITLQLRKDRNEA